MADAIRLVLWGVHLCIRRVLLPLGHPAPKHQNAAQTLPLDRRVDPPLRGGQNASSEFFAGHPNFWLDSQQSQLVFPRQIAALAQSGHRQRTVERLQINHQGDRIHCPNILLCRLWLQH